jgi:hypothetical protein
MKVTMVDIVGAMAAAASPASPEAGIKSGFRMLGAIVEAPRGTVVFQLTGPAKTVGAQEAAFQGMIQAIAKE